jgi:hypothetical protein
VFPRFPAFLADFAAAQRLVAGYDAFGHGVLVEVGAQARHWVGEVAYVYADERALLPRSAVPHGSLWVQQASLAHAAKPTKLWYVFGRRGPGDTTMAKSMGSTKTAGSRTKSQTPRPKTAPQHPVKHSAKAPAPKISPGFKLGRLPPDR